MLRQEKFSRVCEKRAGGVPCFVAFKSHRLRLTGARGGPGGTTPAQGERLLLTDPVRPQSPRKRRGPTDPTLGRPELKGEAPGPEGAEGARETPHPAGARAPQPSNCAPKQPAVGLGATTAAARAGGAGRAFVPSSRSNGAA